MAGSSRFVGQPSPMLRTIRVAAEFWTFRIPIEHPESSRSFIHVLVTRTGTFRSFLRGTSEGRPFQEQTSYARLAFSSSASLGLRWRRQDACPDAVTGPAIVGRRRWTILGRAIGPTATPPEHVYVARNHPTIVQAPRAGFSWPSRCNVRQIRQVQDPSRRR